MPDICSAQHHPSGICQPHRHLPDSFTSTAVQADSCRAPPSHVRCLAAPTPPGTSGRPAVAASTSRLGGWQLAVREAAERAEGRPGDIQNDGRERRRTAAGRRWQPNNVYFCPEPTPTGDQPEPPPPPVILTEGRVLQRPSWSGRARSRVDPVRDGTGQVTATPLLRLGGLTALPPCRRCHCRQSACPIVPVPVTAAPGPPPVITGQ